MPRIMKAASPNSIQKIEVNIRKKFPENWLFESFTTLGNETEEYVTVSKKKQFHSECFA